jgi:hypothetical protein
MAPRAAFSLKAVDLLPIPYSGKQSQPKIAVAARIYRAKNSGNHYVFTIVKKGSVALGNSARNKNQAHGDIWDQPGIA